MPEIKHQFTGGKMNKDLDERLVPNGEYRDAMNIQVATSEGSDVGTAQNILGNIKKEIKIKNLVGGQNFQLPSETVCVGAFSDEKNDTMYYLLWAVNADYVVQWDGTNSKFVIVDKDKSLLKFTSNMVVTGINVIDDMLFWTDNINEPRKINIPRCINGTVGWNQTLLYNSSTNDSTEMKEEHITVIKKGPQVAPDMKLHTSRALDKVYTAVFKISSSTDIDGSDSGFVHNTSGLSDFSNVTTTADLIGGITGNIVYIKLDEIIFENELFDNSTVALGGTGPYLGAGSHVLDALDGWGSDYTQFPGKKVVMQAFNEDGSAPGLPLTDFAIKGEIMSINTSTTSPNYDLEIKITTIDGFPPQAEPGQTRKYAIDLYDSEEKLFEFKFPRFSYRYKYEDGEYSTFAPFTQVAFVPGSFDYHPRKGYNIGMTNKLTKVELSNFITKSTPKDVVAVDVLFKDDSSPSIYVVDTIKPDDYIDTLSPGLNLWSDMVTSSEDVTINNAAFVIEQEAIRNVLPSNQLLRPWDNVPRKALAQEVSGNRVIYANYVQNYDLISAGGYQITPRLNITTTNEELLSIQNTLDPSTNISSNAYKSIKSLREYQLGVVFLDEHGRETPVISNASGSRKIEKKDADKANRFGVSFSSDDYPQSLTHFKFFIKETSTEYYNMAMDRWYSAGDGNIWLAFPSSDRNKIDIDAFLILKKGSDQDTLVTEAARYKVLAIESEAPDFIKTTKRKTFTKNHLPVAGNNSTLFGSLNLPFIGEQEFELKYYAFHGTPGQDLASIEDELYIEFGKIGTDVVSQRYKINSITNSWKPELGDAYTIDDVLSIKLDIPLEEDINFISDDPNGVAPNIIESGTIVNVYRYKVENLEQFDGRFFVKIYFDEVFRNNIELTTVGGGSRISGARKVYSMNNNLYDTHVTDLRGFLTRSRTTSESKLIYGGQPNEAWMNFTVNHVDAAITQGSSSDRVGPSNYGYYYFKEFAANAIYFRRYREKKYTGYGTTSAVVDYGVPQVTPYTSLGNLVTTSAGTNWPTYLNDNINCRALVHLSRGSSGGVNFDGSDHVGYNGSFWKDAPGWEREFGYHQGTTSTAQRFVGYVNNSSRGVTSMWQRNSVINNNFAASHLSEDFAGYNSDEASVRDTEVWFIDKGPYTGGSTTSNQTRSFGNNSEVVGSDNAEDYFDGVQLYSNNWNMRLGFGGIGAKDGMGATTTIQGFWGVGNWHSPAEVNPLYEDVTTANFVNKLSTGFAFRWKEDPTGQIYRIEGNVFENNIYRHSDGPKLWNAVNSFLEVDGGYNKHYSSFQGTWNGNSYGTILPDLGQARRDLRSMAEGLSFNATKHWKMQGIKPALGWDPTTDGAIIGGLDFKLEITGSDGSVTTSSQPVVGKKCYGSNAKDLRVFVTAITVDNAVTGLPQTLHEGMALVKFETTTGVDYIPPNAYIVRRIQPLSSGAGFALYLAGYREPLSQRDHNNLFFDDYFNGGINNTEGPMQKGGEVQFKQVGMNGYSPNSEFNINTISRFNTPEIFDKVATGNTFGAIAAVGYTLEFVEDIPPTEILSENPAIWETEPKDSVGLDIYYEASGSIPARIDESTIASAFPIGTKFYIDGGGISTVIGFEENSALVSGATLIEFPTTTQPTPPLDYSGVAFFRPDDLVITVDIELVAEETLGANPTYYIKFNENLIENTFVLPWHNCYTFKNGVESNRIRDNFNLPYISNGVKASTTLEQEYKEEHRKYGLIYSGIYNSTSGINNLNQFIAGEKITKDVNPTYGSIQKLFSRNSDLVALCEDKILRIVANKDALFNADGNPQLIATDRVLGQTIPFSGEYGISTNPESFASESYRAYFTDKTRGAVLRLSMDGLTPISDAGMRDWFRDNLKGAERLLGSYDDRNNEYNLALNFEDRQNFYDGYYHSGDPDKNRVLTFSEKVSGWVSFKSFTDMQYGISLANEYYTFQQGVLFLHHANSTRNSFYGIFNPSTLDVVLNDNPSAVKVFNTLNYEGSQARVDKFTSRNIDGTTYNDQEYYNLYEKKGWSVESIVTNKEEGYVNEFLEKEGKWFNGINKAVDTSIEKADTSDFTFQGIGVASIAHHYGCTDSHAQNYNPLATIDDGSCVFAAPVYGCTDSHASNYDPNATVDDGSCVFAAIYGCTDSHASNYNQFATIDDGSCILPMSGCTDPLATNYHASATIDDGSCIFLSKPIEGCMDPSANNYNPLAEISTNTCTYDISKPIEGCMDPSANNYNPLAEISTNTCTYDIIIGPADVGVQKI
jgi:hypothetical protein